MDKEILLNKILENLEEGVHVVDKKGNTIVYNNAMAELEELSKADVMNKNLMEVMPSLKNESTHLRVLLENKPILNKFQSYFNENGKKISTINSTLPIIIDNKIEGTIEIAKNITKIRELRDKIFDLQGELNEKKKNNRKMFSFRDIIGQSPKINSAKDIAKMASKTSSNVLIIGESGTGKELFAQSIHQHSSRKNKPYIIENCAAIPENLLEGLLFGTKKGSFTGAVDREGLFKQADKGTLVLDEISSMPMNLQTKLLRVLQNGSFRSLGGQREIEVDVRIIAITNKDPLRLIKEGKMREDLFYRLSVINLFVPPLRERKEDIGILTEYFTSQIEQKMLKKIGGISDEVRRFFYSYDWPGNVRELQHLLEGCANIVGEGKQIKMMNLPYYIRGNTDEKEHSELDFIDRRLISKMYNEKVNLAQYLRQIEDEIIKEALEITKGNITKAANILGITRQGLQYKIKK